MRGTNWLKKRDDFWQLTRGASEVVADVMYDIDERWHVYIRGDKGKSPSFKTLEAAKKFTIDAVG